MERATDFFQNKKDLVFGMLALLATGILGFRFYQDYRREQEELQRNNKPDQERKERLISKDNLLVIMSSIRKECSEEMRILREGFRAERRRVFDDERAYEKVIDDHNKRTLLITESANKKVFKLFKVSFQNFDESVQAWMNDPDINQGFALMNKPEERRAAPEGVSKELLFEILDYNNKRYNEIAYEVPRKSYGYLLVRIQDEIFFKFNLETEELNACYEKFECDDDPEFQSKLNQMKLSTSKLFSN